MWPFFYSAFRLYFPCVTHVRVFRCPNMGAMQLWNNNNDHFKGHCTSFQAVARVNSVGYNSTLFCWYLANFGKLLKSVNDVNMTRTMSHDPQKKGFETAAHLVLPFRTCSICNVLLNRCTTKWNPFFNEKEGRGKNRRLFFSSWGFCSPPPPSPLPHKTRNQSSSAFPITSIDPVKRSTDKQLCNGV